MFSSISTDVIAGTLDSLGLVEGDVARDGNCFYSAIACQLGDKNQRDVRSDLYNFFDLLSNDNSSANDLKVGNTQFASETELQSAKTTINTVIKAAMADQPKMTAQAIREKILKDLKKEAEWGGTLFGPIAAECYRRTIRIVTEHGNCVYAPGGGDNDIDYNDTDIVLTFRPNHFRPALSTAPEAVAHVTPDPSR